MDLIEALIQINKAVKNHQTKTSTHHHSNKYYNKTSQPNNQSSNHNNNNSYKTIPVWCKKSTETEYIIKIYQQIILVKEI